MLCIALELKKRKLKKAFQVLEDTNVLRIQEFTALYLIVNAPFVSSKLSEGQKDWKLSGEKWYPIVVFKT